ncbi:MAG: ABC transporter ATP-binding protein [Deltaproteobacteria bacterium]|nr:ABC transporter ATP-binding protein [Deltaproteobacteria bacterium]
MNAVDIKELSHVYTNSKVLHSLSFQVSQSEIFGILGPNGSGKSTLLKILATLLHPTYATHVLIFGEELRTAMQKTRQKMGVVFQKPSLDKKLSVFENLKFQGMIYGFSGNTLLNKIHKLLDAFDLKDRSDDLVEELSGGLQRRVEIAKALIHSPKLLLLDEPTTGLDPSIRKDLWKYLKLLKESDVTCLISTHIMEDADQCDELLILDQGHLLALNTPHNLKKSHEHNVLILQTSDADNIALFIRDKFDLKPTFIDSYLHIETKEAENVLTTVLEAFPNKLSMARISEYSLEDVFVRLTGHRWKT